MQTDFFKLIAKAIHQNIWLLMLPLLSLHLLIIGEYINRHKNIMQMNQDARQAMERLIIRSSQFMRPNDFKTMLNAIDRTGINLGDYKLTFSLVTPASPAIQKSAFLANYQLPNSTQNFYYLLHNGHWLHYTESPTRSFFDLPLLIVLFEMITISLIIFYFWAGSRFIEPLKNFKLTAERVGIDLNTDFNVHSDMPLIQETVDAMNKMQRRIQDLLNSRTQLLATLSHDLRTPITRLKLRTQFLNDPENSQKITQDLDEMEIMITEILNFASNDVTAEKSIKFDLNALLLSICYHFTDRGYVVDMDLHHGNLAFWGRSTALKRAFINLLENALKYGEQAKVSLTEAEADMIIIIEDNGPGIPEDELEKVLRPYYRSTATQIKNGTGLGLTIAYDIINYHKGTLILKNRSVGGLEVKITLPIVREAV